MIARGIDSADGFTVLEMLVVLAILAMMSALALPAFRRVPDAVVLKTATGEILSALKSTRATAIARNTQTTFVFDKERRTFLPSGAPAVTLPPTVQMEMKTADFKEAGSGSRRILFFPDGSSTGGDMRLTIGSRSMAICISWLTGIARADDTCSNNYPKH